MTVYYLNSTYKNIVCVKFSNNPNGKVDIILENTDGKLILFEIENFLSLMIVR